MTDYIPRSDAELNIWQANLMNMVGEHLTTWGISADDHAALTVLQGYWVSAFSKANNRQNRTSADVRAKDDARRDYVNALRAFVMQWLANNSRISDSERERMGLHVHSDTRVPSPVPETAPVGSVDFSIRLQHSISFVDETTPHSKAKPEGVHGCEVWMKTDGEAPKEESELSYLGISNRSPYVVKFKGAHVGKRVYYWLRWINKRSQCGPWSSTFSAMVAG